MRTLFVVAGRSSALIALVLAADADRADRSQADRDEPVGDGAAPCATRSRTSLAQTPGRRLRRSRDAPRRAWPRRRAGVRPAATTSTSINLWEFDWKSVTRRRRRRSGSAASPTARAAAARSWPSARRDVRRGRRGSGSCSASQFVSLEHRSGDTDADGRIAAFRRCPESRWRARASLTSSSASPSSRRSIVRCVRLNCSGVTVM